MRTEKIDPLFPSAPILNPPPYKFKRNRNGIYVDPDEIWKEPENDSSVTINDDFMFFSFIFIILSVLFLSN